MRWTIGVDALWGGIAGGVGVAGRTFLAQAPAVRAAVEARFREGTQPLAVAGVLTLPATAAYVVARGQTGSGAAARPCSTSRPDPWSTCGWRPPGQGVTS